MNLNEFKTNTKEIIKKEIRIINSKIESLEKEPLDQWRYLKQ